MLIRVKPLVVMLSVLAVAACGSPDISEVDDETFGAMQVICIEQIFSGTPLEQTNCEEVEIEEKRRYAQKDSEYIPVPTPPMKYKDIWHRDKRPSS